MLGVYISCKIVERSYIFRVTIMAKVADILPGFQRETLSFPNDYDGTVVATLVSKPCATVSTKAVLYVHGYCDYFFQKGLADFYNSKGINFYAIDLRKYGRSLLPGQNFNFCKDMKEYYPELDAAINLIKTRDGNKKLLLNGHSTGGLLSSVYLQDRPTAANALFLNSPFFDFNDAWYTEAFLKTIVTGAGLLTPFLPQPAPGLPLYGQSISAAYPYGGDQVFDEKWKPAGTWNPPVLAGWIRAIRLAQLRVHGGLSIKVPTLVMRSDKSGGGKTWNDSYNNSDCVLDVAEISLYSKKLNAGATPAIEKVITNGLHDLVCSRATPRTDTYNQLGAWLTSISF